MGVEPGQRCKPKGCVRDRTLTDVLGFNANAPVFWTYT